MTDKVKNVKQFVDDNNYAIYNTKTSEIIGANLTADMVYYCLYGKYKIKDKHLKVIKNPSMNELKITGNGALFFKDGYVPVFIIYIPEFHEKK